MDTADALARGRRCHAAEQWRDAFDQLGAAAADTPLGPADTERLAQAAYMLGLDEEYAAGLERAHAMWLDAGDVPRAVRCAFWTGHSLLFRGQGARAGGWFALADRLLADDGRDCVERGYLLIPDWLRHMGKGDWETGRTLTAESAAVAERFGDTDLLWLARSEHARALGNLGRTAEGMRLVEEALVVVESGAVSPIVRGILYCNTIAFCRDLHELRHERDWTEALGDWCAGRPQMVAHNGLCLVHRAEVMQYGGAWPDALAEARRAATRYTRGVLNRIASGQAHYRQAEIHRLQGRLPEAEQAYQEAHRLGFDPQPGLALLRLAQGAPDTAAAAIRRAVTEHSRDLERAALLPAYVEVMLAQPTGPGSRSALDDAAAAADRLHAIAEHRDSELLRATAAHSTAAVALARGDAPAALGAARRAWQAWQDLEAPYEAARARVLISRACSALGDEDTAALERAAADAVFAALGAAPQPPAPQPPGHVLSAREQEVLRHLVDGASNRRIAAALSISEHTVARHLQNIFAKLGVSSRTAASTYALTHGLVRPAAED
ncbi:LuxR C-terminal-related transcriptional regulator [Streptomyces bambusae]|uniref:LuxR C-terminal-related transcriptional regulator n=1 Tax=Streptomyces bambusae TaxID=1550616 RepID=UPI0027DF6515|nr:LuxR C-terminal-related transcriptional regulator [Streptomyces bambusae]